MKFLVPLAEGFEESEAVIIIDILRRAGINVTSAALKDRLVTSARKVCVNADCLLSEVRPDEFDGIVLPGGMPGSNNLRDNDRVIAIVQRVFASGGIVGAICAAPKALGRSGILDGKNATCFPGTERELGHARFVDAPVVVDGKIVTGKAAGCAFIFALKVVELAAGREAAEKIRAAIFLGDAL